MSMSQASNKSLVQGGPEPLIPWNNPYDPINYHAFQQFNLISQCVIKPLFLLPGIPSNVVNCLVFWRQGLRDRINLCLFCLALADLLYLLSLIAITQIGPFAELVNELLGKEIYYKSVQYGIWFRSEMRTMSGCITLVLSIERCVCVYFPLRAASLMKTRSMAALLSSIYVITQGGFVYSFFRYEVTVKRNNMTNQVISWNLDLSTTHRSNYTLFRTLEILLLTVLPLCIFATICLATSLTIVKLRAAILWRQTTSSSSSDSHAQQVMLIKMLVLVSCLYIVGGTPYVILLLLSAFLPGFDLGGRYQNSFLTMGVLAVIFTCFNSSFNCVIYYRQSSRYRTEVQAMYCCKRSKVG
ncbi:rhodopsin, GQ-coupled-like [Pomacea canaliculata]|uniref:rhodopsin, GQ-coupled-like n=1 Tax=Pomacea canaliculata TaxID=400727 RepID=UPI000D729E88|nr:rhodopsin, GQ-coupled-like [Pomacea canaliculata]